LRLAQISIRRVGMRLSKLSWRCRRPDRPVVDYSCGHLARIFMHPNPAWRMRASAAYCAQFRRYAVVLRRRCFLDGTLSSDPWRSVAGRLRRPGSGSQSGCRAGLRPAGKPLAWPGSSGRSLVGHRCRGRRERGDRAVCGCRQRHRCRGHEGVRRRVYGAVEVHPSGGRRRRLFSIT